ncbi:MAG: hypothetical protein J5535_01105 [Firmicutes bacterium]|nr:hypothetical protein [Bacillota bacterium]
MRIEYSDKINKEFNAMSQYVERMSDGKPVFKAGAPKDIQQRYDRLVKEVNEANKRSL